MFVRLTNYQKTRQANRTQSENEQKPQQKYEIGRQKNINMHI